MGPNGEEQRPVRRGATFVSDRDGQPDLWLMRKDGSGAVRVLDRTPPEGKRWLPMWVTGVSVAGPR